MRNAAPLGAPPLDGRAATPPSAAKVPYVTRIHGQDRSDDYFWLRRRDEAGVMEYLEAETAYANEVMKPTEALQRALYDEILSHIKQTDLSVPYRLGDFWYYSRTEEGLQYPIYARKYGSLEAPERITLDLNALAAGHSFLALGAYQISDDGRLLAYTLDTTGYRQFTLHVKDLEQDRDLGIAIPRVDDVAWSADGKTLLYTTEDDVSKRRDTFWRYEFAGDGAPVEIYHEPDALYDIAAGRSRDRRFVFLAAFSKATTEWWALRTDEPQAALQQVVPRSEGHRASVEHHGNEFYIVTNRNAEDFRLVRAPQNAPQEEHWQEVVPMRAGVHLDDFEIFERHAVLRVRSGGFSNLEVLDLAQGSLAAVALPETVHAVFPQPNPEYHTDSYRFSYSSLVTPNSIYEMTLATGDRTLLKATEVPLYDPAAYRSALTYATAQDGTQIPISLVYGRDVPQDGSAPMLLYAYGSYGHSLDPTFSASRLILLDRGVVFGVAHVRGGGELGEKWRTSGHLQQKLNTFTDFIAAAEHLVAQKYTSSDRLAIQGGSAGGLLVGAVANMRPELFRAVLSQVPFVDVVNTMLDESLPLTTSEYLEWGNPTVAADFEYMLRYSPYDNLSAQPYPATLVKVSLNDSQVPYWEGAKLVAKLRTLNTGERPILLMVNFGAGHGGASGRYDSLKETAFNQAFILSQIAPSV